MTAALQRRTAVQDAAAKFKALPADPGAGIPEGSFTALVSVFGNVDSYGEVVMPGAFTADLAAKQAAGTVIPFVWSHDWTDPYSYIGTVSSFTETDRGLEATGVLDIAPELANPKAAQVYRLMKSGRITQMSFAFDVIDAGWETVDGDEVVALKTLAIYECGPCLVGVNQETDLLTLKARSLTAGVKAGRVLAQKHLDKLAAAHKALGEVIDAATDDSADDEKGTTSTTSTRTPTSTSTAEDPPGGKAAETGFSPSTVLLLADIHALED